MKHSIFFAISLPVLALAACGQTAAQDDLLRNPLYARFYYQDLADSMANYNIQNDPILRDAEKKGIIESTRTRALEHLKDANNKINTGRRGAFISDTDYATGLALQSGDTLYLGQDFNTVPGPEIHLYLSTVLDPRTQTGGLKLPNDEAVDLGILRSPYGAQSYAIPEGKADAAYRTVILWDRRLERMMGFAQIGL